MEIRPAGPGNYSDYCELVHEFDVHFASEDPAFFRVPANPVRTVEFYQSLFDSDSGVLMAFIEDKAVGFLNYRIDPPVDYPSLVPRKTLFVTILAVTKNHVRQGIGRALMAKVRLQAQELKCLAVELCVQDYNHAALEFYKAEGFASRERIFSLPIPDPEP